MGFFDDLVFAEEPAEPVAEPAGGRTVLARLRPIAHEEDARDTQDAYGRYAPPVDRFAAARLGGAGVVAEGAEVRVVLAGWSVWPRSVTLHLAVFRAVRRDSAGGARQSGLRVGLALADGRRVTSLDGTVDRYRTVTDAQGRTHHVSSSQGIGLIPLDPGLGHPHRSMFKTDVDLYLPELPPPGETLLVVEWPDEGIAETRVAVDAAALRAGARQAVEVWPDLPDHGPDEALRLVGRVEMGGPPALLAPPLTRGQREELRLREEARRRYVPQADWSGMRHRDWADPDLIRARLAGGAPADRPGDRHSTSPLHSAAESGSPESVAALLSHGATVDARDGQGHTALWYAAASADEGRVRALVEAGADVWTPQDGPWSPGRLLLTTALSPLVAGLPGAVPLDPAEVAAFAAADALVATFGARPVHTDGLGVAFVRGLTEDELIRRLGADPAQCPPLPIEDAPFDEDDYENYEESLRYVGVTSLPGDPGGCVVTQLGPLPNSDAVLAAVSAGTAACGLYVNPKGGIFYTLARDGATVVSDELGYSLHEADPDGYWAFRFWQPETGFPYGASELAYACAAAGMRVGDAGEAVDYRATRRWVELPPHLQR